MTQFWQNGASDFCQNFHEVLIENQKKQEKKMKSPLISKAAIKYKNIPISPCNNNIVSLAVTQSKKYAFDGH